MCMDTNNCIRKTCSIFFLLLWYILLMVLAVLCIFTVILFIYLRFFFSLLSSISPNVLFSLRLRTIRFGFFAFSLLCVFFSVCCCLFAFFGVYCFCWFFFACCTPFFRVALFIVCLFLLIYSWKEHISLDAKILVKTIYRLYIISLLTETERCEYVTGKTINYYKSVQFVFVLFVFSSSFAAASALLFLA